MAQPPLADTGYRLSGRLLHDCFCLWYRLNGEKMKAWIIAKARPGEGQHLLDDGWEPFGVGTEFISEQGQISKAIIWIFFRKERKV